MKLVALGLLLLGLVILVFCYVYNDSWLARREPFFPTRPKTNSTEKVDFDYWVYPGDTNLTFEKKRTAEYSSIQGLSRLYAPKVEVIVLEPNGAAAENSSPFRVYQDIPVGAVKPNDNWGDTITSKYDFTVSKIKSNLEILITSMPKDEDLWGRKAKVVITGKYMYPTTSGDKKFIELTTPEFREELPFRFATRAEKDKYESARQQYEQEEAKIKSYNYRVGWFYFISRLCGFILGIGLIGLSIWIFLRSKRQKLKVSD